MPIKHNSKALKILYITCKSDLTRGGQRSLLQLIERLDRDYFEPHVIVPEPGQLSRELFKLGIPVDDVKLPSFSPVKTVDILQSLKRLKHIIHDVRPDIIHADLPRIAHFTYPVRGSAKLLMHLRVATPDGFSDTLLAYECDRLISISNAVARRFLHIPRSRDKISVIYNGIDPDVFKPVSLEDRTELRKAKGLPTDKILIGFLAGFVEIKGHDFILNLWKQVTERHPEAVLILAGDEPKQEQERLKNLVVRNKLTDNVIFIPFDDKPEGLLPAFDFVILPSSEEGFGRIIIEAGACEIPTLGSDIAGIDEAIRHENTGLLAGVRNEQDWIAQFSRLISDKSFRNSLGKSARKLVEKEFTLQGNMKKITEEYRKLAG